MDQYIDFGVAPYALPKVCEALWNNGVHNAFLTLEDGDIHVRWKYDINRKPSITDLMRDSANNQNFCGKIVLNLVTVYEREKI